jgi:aminopeptidase N
MSDLGGEANSQTPPVVRLADYAPPAFLVEAVELYFVLDAAATTVRSRLRFKRNPAATAAKNLMLDGHDLELTRLELDGQVVAQGNYEVTAETLTVREVPERFELYVENIIHPDRNTALEGLYLSAGMLCTQCEAEGFRRITFFPDRPDVMTVYTVTLDADRQQFPVLLSNGNAVAQGELPDNRHWVRWEDPFPKPSYLFALVAGDLVYQEDEFVTFNQRRVTLRLYVEKENIGKCDHGLRSLKQAMRWDEETYGREYDLDIFNIVAVNDFNMGAMENKSLNIFNAACVLASPETATDADYDNIQGIIGHEYFHNWSGNRVTCRDWFQLSLKEGFTVFRDQEFSADMNSRAVKRIEDVDVLRNHQFAQDAGPMAHPVRPDEYMEISNFYTVTVYNKGAEVVRMLANLLGPQGFRKGTDLYFGRHDGQAVTTDDFIAAMQDANNIDLTQFKRWYSQAGTPELHIEDDYDAQQQTYTLRVRQTSPATPGQPDKQPFHVPLRIGLLDADGRECALRLENESGRDAPRSRVLEIREAEQEFRFIDIPSAPVPSLLRSFSAPVKVMRDWRDDELAFLFAHDRDEFNRWDAGQQLMLRHLQALIADVQAGHELRLSPMLIEAVRRTLHDTQLDKALVAHAVTLPSETYMADQCAVVDVDAIHRARQFMLQSLATELHTDFADIYAENRQDGAYEFNAQAMGTRALKNRCLAFLLEAQDAAAIDVALQQFYDATNMTDRIGALGPLVHHDRPEVNAALTRFYDDWQHDPQVVDKWFALQAVSHRSNTLDRVVELTHHDAFTIRNPNKVRALIGRFCMANPVRFHAADGRGYRLLRDYVLRLDKLNPQLAARLIQAMIRWRRYDVTRQELMRNELQAIQEIDSLSRDVYEVVSKGLAA